jgi:hypothetical protein
MEKSSCSDRVKNIEVLQRVKEEKNIVHATVRKKANWIGNILRRNCLLIDVIEGKIEGRTEATDRRGTGCKQLIQNPKEMKWKEKARSRTLWRTRFGTGYGPVARQTME